MMGVVSKKGIKAEWISPFKEMSLKGKTRCDMPEPGHHDGWGMVAYFRENFPEYLERQPHSVTQDPEHFKSAADAIEAARSKAALVHFRKISVGQPSIANTHPFLHNRWAFCHNGTIYDSDKIPLKSLKPGGVTDSERFFLYIMENLDPKKPALSIGESIDWMKRNFKYSSLTFLLTDGAALYAYRNSDPEFTDYYTLYQGAIGSTEIVCSEPLPQVPAAWRPLQNGAFVELRH